MIINAIIEQAIFNANQLVGVKESEPNRGTDIDAIQEMFRFKGVAYCALFVQYCFKKACEKFQYPEYFPGTASSQALYNWANQRECVYTDYQLIRRGHIPIWRKFMKFQGHTGIVIQNPAVNAAKRSFVTIEGNTSNSDFGSQRDGDGIYQRVRYAEKIDFNVDSFWLRGFINTNKLLDSFSYDKE